MFSDCTDVFTTKLSLLTVNLVFSHTVRKSNLITQNLVKRYSDIRYLDRHRFDTETTVLKICNLSSVKFQIK